MRIPPLMVRSLIGAPPLPSLPCISRGLSVLCIATGISDRKLPLRQRVSMSACAPAGSATRREPFVVSGSAGSAGKMRQLEMDVSVCGVRVEVAAAVVDFNVSVDGVKVVDGIHADDG